MVSNKQINISHCVSGYQESGYFKQNKLHYSIEILQHNVYTYIISLILEPFLKPIISVDFMDKPIQILNYYDFIDWVNNDYIYDPKGRNTPSQWGL